MIASMPQHDLIRQLETTSADAMPALYTRYYDGWLLRFASGYTRRANSIQPVYASSLPCDEKIAFCEQLYQRQHYPVIFKLTEASQPTELDARLASRGYELGPTVHIQTLSLAATERRTPVSGSVRLNNTWFHAYTDMNEVPEQHHATLGEMLKKIVSPTWYALLKDANGQPVAVALAVLNGSLVGIFDVVVAAEQRGRGIGTRLIQDLLAWGKANGAHTAYLQVNGSNTAGLRLYDRLGFRDAYTYWYRVKSKS
jgi:ribosomal protein S18 acetylase RimI-like enzyme